MNSILPEASGFIASHDSQVDGILSNYPVDSLRTPRFAVTMSSFVNFDDELAFLEASGHDDLGRDETDEMLLQHQLITLPLLNFAAVRHHAEAFPSRGLLGTTIGERLYLNTNTLSSGVICSVQVSLLWAWETDVADEGLD